ncbi:TIGR00730 family Rossman fold protein [bacterium]|nr:TIGR00730 family Rossman fold protein [bacterium]
MRELRRVAVFCGSQAGDDPAFAETARELARGLVARRLELVYGGGSIGLMGVLADEVLARGGHVIGVIPRTLFVREVGHRALTECRLVETMHERKAIMADLASAFVTLPGGYGTLDETFEALTWGQLGIHSKPVVLVNARGFFGPLVAAVDRAAETGFLSAKHRSLLNVVSTPEAALELISSWKPPFPPEEWLSRETR